MKVERHDNEFLFYFHTVGDIEDFNEFLTQFGLEAPLQPVPLRGCGHPHSRSKKVKADGPYTCVVDRGVESMHSLVERRWNIAGGCDACVL